MSSHRSAAGPDGTDPRSHGSDAYPLLTAQQRQRIDAISPPEPVALGQKLFQSGDSDVDLFFADDAVVEIVREATHGAPEQVLTRLGPGQFVGELNLLTSQNAFLTARVVVAGTVRRIGPDAFRQLLAQDVELSEIVVRMLLARRTALIDSAGETVEIIGGGIPPGWTATDSWGGAQIAPKKRRRPSHLPAAIVNDTVITNATAALLA